MGQAKEEVIILPAGSTAAGATTDRFGDRVAPTPEQIAAGGTKVRALVWPRSAADNSSREIVNERQNTVIVGLTALMPPGTVITPTDRVFARGHTYEVEGEPGDYKRKGIMVALRKVTG